MLKPATVEKLITTDTTRLQESEQQLPSKFFPFQPTGNGVEATCTRRFKFAGKHSGLVGQTDPRFKGHDSCRPLAAARLNPPAVPRCVLRDARPLQACHATVFHVRFCLVAGLVLFLMKSDHWPGRWKPASAYKSQIESFLIQVPCKRCFNASYDAGNRLLCRCRELLVSVASET